jgi:hypothetical protein
MMAALSHGPVLAGVVGNVAAIMGSEQFRFEPVQHSSESQQDHQPQ